MNKILLFIILFLFIGCKGERESDQVKQNQYLTETKTLTVAIAANVQYAMIELISEFKKLTGIDIKTTVSSSGKLTAQIAFGAPYDLFLSADMKYPNTLYKSKHAVTIPKVYARGTLVLWTLKNIDLSRGLAVLTDDKIQKIAIANPKNAPYGLAAVQSMKYHRIYTKVSPKLVFGGSVSQTNQYIYSKSVDAGITAKSVVLSPKMKSKGKWFTISEKAYQTIEQGVVILKHGRKTHPLGSQQFYDFLFTSKAGSILKQYGYELP